MSIRSDIEDQGKRMARNLPDDAQSSAPQFADALTKLAKEVEFLQPRMNNLEGRVG